MNPHPEEQSKARATQQAIEPPANEQIEQVEQFELIEQKEAENAFISSAVMEDMLQETLAVFSEMEPPSAWESAVGESVVADNQASNQQSPPKRPTEPNKNQSTHASTAEALEPVMEMVEQVNGALLREIQLRFVSRHDKALDFQPEPVRVMKFSRLRTSFAMDGYHGLQLVKSPPALWLFYIDREVVRALSQDWDDRFFFLNQEAWFNTLLEMLKNAWKRHKSLHYEPFLPLKNLSDYQRVEEDERFLVQRLNITGPNLQGDLAVCYPLNFLVEGLAASTKSPTPSADASKNTAEGAPKSSFQMVVPIVGQAEIRRETLYNLKAGQILTLQETADAPIQLKVPEGKDWMAQIRAKNGKIAFRLLKSYDN